ncbi:hypothetical protein [Metallosphaera hakonensis]|nr:hypothetical protein [Metallosphaera hakonensis]
MKLIEIKAMTLSMRAIHNLSKDSRERIVAILLQKRSKSELAKELGISPASIVKFYKGKTHASDITIQRALAIADNEEKQDILRLIIEDLAGSILDILSEYQDVDSEKLNLLKKVLEERDKRKILTSLDLI